MTYWPTRFPFSQKPTDLDPELELRSDAPSKVEWALACHPDQLESEGFGRADIEEYVRWKKGRVTITDPQEIVRMNRLGLLVILNAP